MINYFLISRGNLSSELLSAATSITQSKGKNIKALNINWNDPTSEIRKNIEKNIQNVKNGKIIFLTESFGDTSTNFTIPYLEKGKVEIVTGMNLDMIVSIFKMKKEISMEETAEKIRDRGINSLKVINKKKISQFKKIILLGIRGLPRELYNTSNLSISEEVENKPEILSIYPGEEIFEIEDKLKHAISFEKNHKTLIMVDIIFSIPFYHLLKNMVRKTNSTVVSGINSPMVSYVISNLRNGNRKFIEKLIKRGKRNIKILSKLL